MEWKGKLDKRTEAEDEESGDKAAKAPDRAGVSSRNNYLFLIDKTETGPCL